MLSDEEVEAKIAQMEATTAGLAATVAGLTARVDQIEAAHAEVAVSKRRDERAFAMLLGSQR